MKKQKLSLVRVALCASIAALLLLLPSARASAQGGFSAASNGGNGFGAPGEWVITGAFEGHLHNGWELRLHPSLDYFIAPNVSVGGLVGLTYHSGNPSTTTLELGVRAGYNLHIVDRVSFWPTAGIFYSHTRVSGNPGTSGSSTSLGIFAPFLYHLVPHLFVGVGPSFNLPLDNGGNSYGLDSVVGGWF